MYYKIKDNVLRRNELDSFMLLHPVSKKLMIFGKSVSDCITKEGIINSIKINNDKIINNFENNGFIEEIDSQNKFYSYGSSSIVSAPLNVTIQLTNRCNLKCKHCHRVDKGLLDFDEKRIHTLIDEIYKMKVFNINLSGGEPLMYRGIQDIVKYINSKGMKVTMSTNLLLWTKGFAEKMLSSGLQQIHVSLDSSSEEFHDDLRGLKNSHSRTVKNIKMIKEIGIDFTAVTTLTDQTINEYGEVIDLAYQLGASGHKTNILVPQGQGSALKVGYYKNIDLLKGYINIFRAKKKYYENKMKIIGETMFLISMGDDHIDKPKILEILCPAGILTCAITEKGEVLPCPFYSEVSVGNIYEGNFQNIWENSITMNNIRTAKMNINSGCQARGYGISKSIYSDDPYISI